MTFQENPGEEEYEQVVEILKAQTELLQVSDQEELLLLTFNMNTRTATNANNFVWYSFCLQQNNNQGRDASRQLLMALLRSLWKYFVFNSQRRPALTPNFAR